MRTSNRQPTPLFVTTIGVILLTGCGATSALERADDAGGKAQRDAISNESSPKVTQSANNEAENDAAGVTAEPTDVETTSPVTENDSSTISSHDISVAPANTPANLSANTPEKPQAARSSAPSVSEESTSQGAIASDSATSQARKRQTKERPGLGTMWGETRTSYVNHVGFTRNSPNDPFALFRIFYNDEEGILAQTGLNSLDELSSNNTEDARHFVSVEIVDPNGNALLGLNQNNRTYVLGRNGDRYAIRIRNHEPQRFEVVTTVDGLDVIDGTQAQFGKRGYILDSYGTLLIEGFRRSSSTIAAFRFGSVANSYAARTSGDRNVGVIGVAVFAERVPPVPRRPTPVYTNREIEKRETADPFPRQYAQPPRPRPMFEAR
jgi:hypothetical protein